MAAFWVYWICLAAVLYVVHGLFLLRACQSHIAGAVRDVCRSEPRLQPWLFAIAAVVLVLLWLPFKLWDWWEGF